MLRLKETFSNTSRERDAFAEENRRLKELLMAHGISFDLSSPMAHVIPSSAYDSSSGSGSGYGPGSTSTGYTSPPSLQHHASSNSNDGMGLPHPLQQGMDYDQIGIDFVLTYDRSPYLSPPPNQ